MNADGLGRPASVAENSANVVLASGWRPIRGRLRSNLHPILKLSAVR